MSKKQYGVSVRHDPDIHNAVSAAAAWYNFKLQNAFDALVHDRAKALLERMEKDLRAMREAPAGTRFKKPTFAEVVRELFKLEIPPYLGGGNEDSGPNKYRQRKTRHKKGEE